MYQDYRTRISREIAEAFEEALKGNYKRNRDFLARNCDSRIRNGDFLTPDR